MLTPMLRTALIASAFALALAAVPAAASSPPTAGIASAATAQRVAKAGKKKKPDKGKPEDKVERSEETARDPRAAEPASAPGAGGGRDAGMTNEVRRGMARIEFDDRLIQGQTNKANAIYLFERRESALRSLLRKRTHFHEEIDETLE